MDSKQLGLPYESRQIANSLIEIAEQYGYPMSIMRLLKLAYMAHGWALAIYDEPLVNENVQAWKYGPVIPIIYYVFRPQGIYGLKAVPILKEHPITEDIRDHMETVFELYENLSDGQLTQLTHINGGPWHQKYEPGKLGIIIPNELISKHFKSKIDRSKTQSSDF